jgi:hypothetical protein
MTFGVLITYYELLGCNMLHEVFSEYICYELFA